MIDQNEGEVVSLKKSQFIPQNFNIVHIYKLLKNTNKFKFALKKFTDYSQNQQV